MGTASGGTSHTPSSSNRFLSSSNHSIHSGFSITRTRVYISSWEIVGKGNMKVNAPYTSLVSPFFMSSMEVYLRKNSKCQPSHSPPSSKFCHVGGEAVVWTARKTHRRNSFAPRNILGQGKDSQVIVDERESVARMTFYRVDLQEC